MAERVGVGWISVPFAILLSLSIAGIGSAWMGGSARIPFVAGLDSYMPSWLGKVHPRYATPYAALILQGCVSAILVILNFVIAGVQETFQKLLSLAVVLQLVPFLYMFGALVKFAVTEEKPTGQYGRTAMFVAGLSGLLTTILGIALVFFPAQQISSLFWYEVWMVGMTLFAVGLAAFFFFVYGRKKAVKLVHMGTAGSAVPARKFAIRCDRDRGVSPLEATMPSGVQTEVKTYQMFINGEWVASKSAKTFPVYDPSTEEVIAQVPDANADDVNRAVAAAKAAFEEGPWATTTAQERGRVLFRFADKVRQNLPALAELECRNTGKPIVEAEYDLNDVATCFEYYGGLATKITGHVNPVPDNAMSLSLKEPVGVAGQIIPWNYPLLMAAWKLAPALAAGCTCVLKPAEQTPLTALEFAKHFAACGLPPGVVNIVTGFGETCGAPIVQHPDVNKIAFTGSAAVGKTIVKQAADTVKRVTLELGGKSPNIFFADADFEAAIDGALFGVFINQGEVCSAGSRILVEKSIYKNFVEAMTREGEEDQARAAA